MCSPMRCAGPSCVHRKSVGTPVNISFGSFLSGWAGSFHSRRCPTHTSSSVPFKAATIFLTTGRARLTSGHQGSPANHTVKPINLGY